MGTFDMLFVGTLWTYSEKISLLRILFTSNPNALGLSELFMVFLKCPMVGNCVEMQVTTACSCA